MVDSVVDSEYVVEQPLNRKTARGRTYYLVRWPGRASAADSWGPAERPANCPKSTAARAAGGPEDGRKGADSPPSRGVPRNC